MRMTSTIFAVLMFTFVNLAKECEAQVSNSNPPKVMCYLMSPLLMERRVSNPPVNGLSVEEWNDPGHCTHVAFTTMSLGNQLFLKSPGDFGKDEVGQLREAYFRKGHEMRRQKPGLKLLLDISVSSLMIETPSGNQKFINHSIQYLKENELDGIHLDCEEAGGDIPGQNRCVQLMSELCEEYGKHNLDLSATIPQASLHPIEPTQNTAFHSCLQFVIIETNFRPSTSADKTEILNPIFNENATITWYEEKGIPRSKMLVIFTLSAYTFTLKNPQNISVGSSSTGPGLNGIPYWDGQIPVSEMLKRLNNSEEGWVVRRDASSNTPYAVNSNGIWATYEDFSSITDKARYVKDSGLGGVGILSMEMDDWRGELEHGRFPLIRAIYDALQSQK